MGQLSDVTWYLSEGIINSRVFTGETCMIMPRSWSINYSQRLPDSEEPMPVNNENYQITMQFKCSGSTNGQDYIKNMIRIRVKNYQPSVHFIPHFVSPSPQSSRLRGHTTTSEYPHPVVFNEVMNKSRRSIFDITLNVREISHQTQNIPRMLNNFLIRFCRLLKSISKERKRWYTTWSFILKEKYRGRIPNLIVTKVADLKPNIKLQLPRGGELFLQWIEIGTKRNLSIELSDVWIQSWLS